MNFVDLFNAVIRVANPDQSKYRDAKELDDTFESLEIDSFDRLVMLMYLCELYGVSETLSKSWHPLTLRELHELVSAVKTREPASIDEAVASLR